MKFLGSLIRSSIFDFIHFESFYVSATVLLITGVVGEFCLGIFSCALSLVKQLSGVLMSFLLNKNV